MVVGSEWFLSLLFNLILQKMKKEKIFPNGFTSWQETHFETVQAITKEWLKDSPKGIVAVRQGLQGHGGLYELAKELTDKFEKQNKGRTWDGDFFDEIENFLNKELYP